MVLTLLRSVDGHGYQAYECSSTVRGHMRMVKATAGRSISHGKYVTRWRRRAGGMTTPSMVNGAPEPERYSGTFMRHENGLHDVFASPR